jgi:hypothetical protein
MTTSASHGVPVYRHLLHAFVDDPPRTQRRLRNRGATVITPTPGSGGAQVPTLSVSGATVVPTLAAALVMSAREAVGDSTAGVSGALLPNAS